MKRGNAFRHGHSRPKTPTYSSWSSMIARCTIPSATGYKSYGAAGVTVCNRWLSFENFLVDMGERPSPEHSLDRFPVRDGNYEPGNCRWATRSQQSLNRKTTRAVRRSDGATFKSIKEAAEATPGANRRSIKDVCAGRKYAHSSGGFGWAYV